MNRVVKFLIISDFFLVTGLGLIQPILSIFVAQRVEGGSIFAAGIAAALFLIFKSLVQLPFSRYVDTHKNTLPWLHIGNALVAASPLLLIIDGHIAVVYAAQIICGIGAGLTFPVWMQIWNTHLDMHHEGFEWSLYSTVISVGAAVAAAVGAGLTQYVGFETTFILVFALSVIGTVLLFPLAKIMQISKTMVKVSHAKSRSVARTKHRVHHHNI